MWSPSVPYEFLLRGIIWRYDVFPELLWQSLPAGGYTLNPATGLIIDLAQRISNWQPKDWENISKHSCPSIEIISAVKIAVVDKPPLLQGAVASLLYLMGELIPPRPLFSSR